MTSIARLLLGSGERGGAERALGQAIKAKGDGWSDHHPLSPVSGCHAAAGVPSRAGERGSCNTPGVYHQLSSRFELKHDRLVEMTMPKSNLWK
jgi:hypothetical protein